MIFFFALVICNSSWEFLFFFYSSRDCRRQLERQLAVTIRRAVLKTKWNHPPSFPFFFLSRAFFRNFSEKILMGTTMEVIR
jgi:hypothetical protein